MQVRACKFADCLHRQAQVDYKNATKKINFLIENGQNFVSKK